jgi:hypothetical protein
MYLLWQVFLAKKIPLKAGFDRLRHAIKIRLRHSYDTMIREAIAVFSQLNNFNEMIDS